MPAAFLSRFFAGFPAPFLALVLVSLFAHVTMSGGRVAAALFALREGGSETWGGVAYSLYSLLPALLSLHMGRWMDRIGTRRVMHVSLVLMVCGLAMPVISPTLPMVLLAAVLSGFGFGSYMLAAHVSISGMQVAREGERVGMIAWLQMGNSVSSVLGPSMVGMVIDGSGFRAAFATLAGIVFVGGILSLLTRIPDTRRQTAEQARGSSVVRLVFTTPSILRIYLLAMSISLAWDAFNFMVPVLGQARGYSATSIGLILSCFAIGTFSIRTCLPWLSRRVSEWRMLMASLGLAALVFLLLPLADSIYLHAALGFTFGLSAGVGQPNILSLIFRAMPPGRTGEGAGLRSMMGNSMGLTGPTAFGALAALLGVLPVFLCIAFIMGTASWQAHRGWRGAQAALPPHLPGT